ncbi:phage terminase large subunit [Lactobacillus sp.]|uniref:phage terminase large subunit n=1 Tax=Lactobacillus sp. TaxID=1591 RepID=UPI0019A848A7|nr:phage terminase large subunit [Lactobacillus sp.]MBD5430131.1 phage terminase large subunit [Lactobacillus sp.]
MKKMKLNLLERQGIVQAAKMELARRSYADYFLLANPTAKMYPHIKVICDALQKIIDGEQHFYIIEMPPRHGKSLAITKTFASYYMMKYPEREVMITAYSKKLYKQFSGDERRKFKEWAPRLYGLTTSVDSADEFQIAGHQGKFHATSMTGGATGMGADLLIIDDPVKNAIEASSPTIKDRIWNEWTDTFSTRVQGKKSSVIVIMTRWQTDDLAGKLLQEKAFPWEEIKFPAIAENIPLGETDELGRVNGDPLSEERMSLKALLRQKKNMGTQRFNALYQQSPTIEGGNIFKREWVKYYVPDKETMAKLGLTEKEVAILPRHLDKVAQSWDATFKSGENDDFVAGQVWARREANYYLMPGDVHKRMTFTETLAAIREMTARYPQANAKYIEDKANGSAIIDTLKDEIGGIIPVEPEGGKEVRANAVSPLWEAGNVYVPHPLWRPEIEDWLQEIFQFPNGPHDDRVDSMTQALNNIKVRQSEDIFSNFYGI